MVKRSSNGIIAPLLLSLSVATFSLAQYSSSNTACTKHYVVEDGDTCDIIGQKTFTSTAQIMSLNLPQAGPNCYGLQTGVQLCLGTYGNDCQLVYRAKNADTCDSITSQFKISTSTLLTNNAMLECSQVYGGLMLCVVDGIVRPPAAPALNISYDPLSPGYTNANSTLPLGTAIIAVNAATLPAAPVQSSASSSATKDAASSTSSSKSKTASDKKAADHDKDHHHHHVDHHNAHHEGHKPQGHSHHAAAKKWQDSHK